MTKIYIETSGCALNQADSEQMAGLLKEADFEIVDTVEEAGLIILNTCTVKGPTEDKFFSRLEKLKQLGKPIVVAGCIPQTNPEKFQDVSLIGTRQIDNIVMVVEETLHDNHIVAVNFQNNPKLSLLRVRKNPVVEIIPICRGCLGECTYCKVRLARGYLKSYSIEDIKKRFKLALRQGAKEIWLTAQDTGCYGLDINTNLPALLKELVNIPGNYKIRVGMLNPNHVLKYLDELVEIFKSEKIFNFLHLPIQSGNDEVLKEMGRKYTVEDIKNIVSRFKESIPSITLATDIICGFPGETKEQFNDTLSLLKLIQPPVINISRFWARSKTKAAEMENQVSFEEIKDRSRRLTDLYHNIARIQNERWIGWEGDVLIDEKGKDNSLVGRNFAYKPIIVHGDYSFGETVNVKIKKVTSFDLRT